MDLIEKTKSYFRAYERHDPGYVKGELAEGFTFTSPYDEHIDREAYFKRCWPAQPLHQKFEFISIAQDGDHVMVVYECAMLRPNTMHPDMHFRNAEMHTFENGKLKSVEVFFGDPPNGLTRDQFAAQSGTACAQVS